MRNVLNKSCRENQNTHFIYYDFFFFENRAVQEIMSKNKAQLEGSQMTSQYGAYDLHAG